MPQLLITTGQPKIDSLLQGLIELYESIFPDRVRSYLLMGSYADGTSTTASDLDLVAVFKGSARPEELDRFRNISRSLSKISAILLDCSAIDEITLSKGAKASIKMASVLYGDLILNNFLLEPLDVHIQRSMFLAIRALHILHGQPQHLIYPIKYPDPDGEFYGYEQWGGYLGNDTFVPGLRLLVTETTMMATTLVALAIGIQAGTKKQALILYRTHLGDEWAEFLEELYRLCKTEWKYEIPESPVARMVLRLICERMLPFENHFLAVCRETVLKNIDHPDPVVQHFAQETLNRIGY
jgi:predicted nucleotidyltransferase